MMIRRAVVLSVVLLIAAILPQECHAWFGSRLFASSSPFTAPPASALASTRSMRTMAAGELPPQATTPQLPDRLRGGTRQIEGCTFTYGKCQGRPDIVGIRIGGGIMLGNVRINKPEQAAAIFQGQFAPGHCNAVAPLLVQLLTAKLNINAGANAADAGFSLGAADQWLRDNDWQNPIFAPLDLVQLRELIRNLADFNYRASTAGDRCGPSFTCPGEECEAQEFIEERMGAFTRPVTDESGHAVQTQSAHKKREMHTMGSYDAIIAGDYATRNMPNLGNNIGKVGFTTRDWERWDSYDYQDLAARLTDPIPQITTMNPMYSPLDASSTPGDAGTPMSPGVQSTPAAFASEWRGELDAMYRGTFFSSAYFYLRMWNDNDNYVILKDLNKTSGAYTFNPHDVHTNMSMSVGQFYIAWRAEKKAQMKVDISAAQPGLTGDALDNAVTAAFDALNINWLVDVPGVAKAAEWLERYINIHLGYQNLALDPPVYWIQNPSAAPQDQKKFDVFGCYQQQNWIAGVNLLNDRYLLFDYWWWAQDIGLLYGRYVHLLSEPLIRRIRRSAMASLWALETIHAEIGIYDWFSAAQWLIRQGGYNALAFVLVRSQEVLTKRGTWDDTLDKFSTSRSLGTWDTNEAITLAETRLAQVHARFTSKGLVEFLSSYHGLSMQYIEMGMMHAASSKLMGLYTQMYQLYWADLVLNYHPGSNSFGGPSSRSYDMTTGTHNIADRHDLPLCVQWSERPHCTTPITSYSPMGTYVAQPNVFPSNLCSSNSIDVQPSSGTYAMVMQRLFATSWHAAGHLYAPLDLLRNVVQNAPIRVVEQKFSNVLEQDRYNFISPTIEMGHAGENFYSTPTSTNAVARLAGQVAAGPTSQDQNGQTFVTPYVRLFPELCDTPFKRERLLGVAGKDLQKLGRQVVAQYQSYMLVTQTLSPQRYWTDTEWLAPWNTDLVLPLAVDALYADGVRLPITLNTSYTIPPNAIITVRHKGNSICVRMLRGEHMSNIAEATSIAAYTADKVRMWSGKGLQPYSLMWQVDEESINSGVGRITLHHKHRGDNLMLKTNAQKSFRSAWLWLAGATANDQKMKSLQTALRGAKISEQTDLSNWNPLAQNVTDKDYCGTCAASTQRWRLSAAMGSPPVTLAVDRLDTYQGYPFTQAYQQPETGAPFVPPYYVDAPSMQRTVNGKQMLQWTTTEPVWRMLKIKAGDVFQPYK